MIKEDAIIVNHFKPLIVTSAAFKDHEAIPEKYTCDGENTMPPLDIKDIPIDAKSLALIIDDPDAPKKTWVHYIAWNIPIDSHITQDDLIKVEGINDFRRKSYGGPCPPDGQHRYFFKVYALDNLLDLPEDALKHDLEKAMAEHIIAFGELTGVYTKK
jgi:Raf kinase inhibitor-like YbhB/YbcL family protein